MTPDQFKTRYDPARKGILTLLCCAEGYCMVRSKGAAPFVMSLKEWLALPTERPCIT